jgi:hypothetical protein
MSSSGHHSIGVGACANGERALGKKEQPDNFLGECRN